MSLSKEKKPFKKIIYPYLFILPFALITITFFIIPALLTIVMAFTNMNVSLKADFVGLGNFIKVLSDPNLGVIIRNTFQFGGFALLFTLLVAITIAISTQYFLKGKLPGAIYRVLWLIPSVIPSVVYVAFWKWLFDPTWDGFMNKLLKMFGSQNPMDWFNNFSMEIVIIATVLSSVSGSVILLSASINSIPQDLYMSARVDGASEKSVIMKIILPTLKWPLMYMTISSSIGYIASYFFILLLTEGGPLRRTTTISLYSYQQAFDMKLYGYGASISLIVVFFALILTFLLINLFDFDSMIQPSRIED